MQWIPPIKPAEYDPAVNHPACIALEKEENPRYEQECPVCEGDVNLLILDCKHVMCKICFVGWAVRPGAEKMEISCPICRAVTTIGKITFCIKTFSGSQYEVSSGHPRCCVSDLMSSIAKAIAPEMSLIKNGQRMVDHDFDPSFDSNPEILHWVDFKGKVSSPHKLTLHGLHSLGTGQVMRFLVVTQIYPMFRIDVRKNRPITYLYHLLQRTLKALGDDQPKSWGVVHIREGFVDQTNQRPIQDVFGPYTIQYQVLSAYKFA